MGGITQCRGGRIDVGLIAAREPADADVAQLACDLADRFEVVFRRIRIAGLDDVDTERSQRFGHAQFLRTIQRATRTLFAVTQRRIEDQQALAHRRRLRTGIGCKRMRGANPLS